MKEKAHVNTESVGNFHERLQPRVTLSSFNIAQHRSVQADHLRESSLGNALSFAVGTNSPTHFSGNGVNILGFNMSVSIHSSKAMICAATYGGIYPTIYSILY